MLRDLWRSGGPPAIIFWNKPVPMRQARPSESTAEERLTSVATKFSHLPLHPMGADAIPLGTRARRLHRRIVLADHSMKGLRRLVDQFAIRPVLNLLRIIPLIIRLGPKARRDCGVPIRRQLLDLLRLVLIHGGKPWIYYMTERYRSGGMGEIGALLMRNEMKNGLWRALNLIDAEARALRRNLGDKDKAAEWFTENNLPHPRTLMLVERGNVVWQGGPLSDLDQDLFVKVRNSRGAKGTAGYRRTAAFEYLDDQERPINLAQIIVELLRRSRRESLLVQPLLHNHPAIADLTGDSLITLRVVTCLDEQLRPVPTIAYFRSVAKLEPRWNIGRLEEFASTIDLETGVLGRMTSDKADSLSEWGDRHPITGAMATGRIVPFWRETVELVIRAHSLLPGRVVVGWDVAVTEDGPMLLEGNSFPDNIYPQRLYQKPMGHLRFGELLNFHFDRIEAELDKNRKLS
jgi:hypothetical protein